MKSTRRIYFFFLFIILIGMATEARAQNVETQPMRGFMPNMDQLSSPVDNIQVVGGKLHLQIPLASLARGQGGTGYNLNLEYDSNLYNLQTFRGSAMVGYSLYDPVYAPYNYAYINSITTNGGWFYNARNNNRIESDGKTLIYRYGDDYPIENVRINRYRLVTPDGSSHTLYLRGFEQYDPDGIEVVEGWTAMYLDGHCNDYAVHNGWPAQTNGILTFYTNDGSYIKFEVNTASGVGTIYFPDGRRTGLLNGVPTEFDANGNGVSTANGCYDPPPSGDCSKPYTTIYDSANTANTIQIDYNITDANNTTDTLKRDRVTAPGPNGHPITYAIDWEVMTIGGNGRQYATGRDPLYTSEWRYSPLNFRFWVVKYIHNPLPAPQLYYPVSLGNPPAEELKQYSYEFRYWDNNSLFPNGSPNPGFGQLNYMRMPSGAIYNYNYMLDSVDSEDYQDYPEPQTIVNGIRVAGKQITHDSLTNDLQWSFAYTSGYTSGTTVTSPDGGQTVHHIGVVGGQEWTKNLISQIDEPNGSIRKRQWAQNPPPYFREQFNQYTPNNPYMTKEIVTVGNASGVPTKSAISDFAYDKNGNLTSKTEYDWVAYGVETGSVIKRKTQMDYYVPASTYPYWNGHVTSIWPMGTSRRLNAVRRQTIFEGPSLTPKAAVEYEYTNYNNDAYSKGNVKYEKHWDSTKPPYSLPALPALPTPGSLSPSNAQVITNTYDYFGNLTDKYESGGQTHITYDAGTLVTRVDTGYQTPEQRSIGYIWNDDGTALLSKTDLNNNLTTEYGYDDLSRQISVRNRNSANVLLQQTTTAYDDANRKVIVKSGLYSPTDNKLQSITHYDQLGRVKLVQKSDGPLLADDSNYSNDSDGIKANTLYYYQTGGKRVVSSSPYQELSDSTLEWSCTQYDLLNRVTAVASYKGSTAPTDCESTSNRTGISRTVYDTDDKGIATTVTDPLLKKRTQSSDVLGRLVRVIEDSSDGIAPHNELNYQTNYAYDVLGNLTEVRQEPHPPETQYPQIRSFTYSSLGRLLTATNPESGTITYTYDGNGDLWKKKDARGITATMTYDPLHRVLTKSYTNNSNPYVQYESTPAVTYAYYLKDTASSPNIGQLKLVSSDIASTLYTYNQQGQVAASMHSITGLARTATFTYEYYLNGALKNERYPSGRLVNYDVDDAGRTNKTYTSSRIYADLPVLTVNNVDIKPFTADGRIAHMQLGNNLWETHDYQTPGTPTVYKLGRVPWLGDMTQLEYGFHASQNNGNVQSQRIIRNNGTPWFQSYEYDGVNRLKKVEERRTDNITTPPDWSQDYGYDQYGNRFISANLNMPAVANEPTSQSQFNVAKNQLSIAGIIYDFAGNQTHYDNYDLVYDGENRNTIVKVSGSAYVTFAYDGDGRRVKKQVTNGATTHYVYDALGQMAAEYSTQAPTTPGTSYMFTDMLGSVRTITDQDGAVVRGAVVESYDYLPFGRMLSSSKNGRSDLSLHFPDYPDTPNALNSRTPQKFTGKERDAETGLDYFEARYLSSAQGRFISTDPYNIITEAENKQHFETYIKQPQNWNRYAYVWNNPLRYIDPHGETVYVIAYTVGNSKGDEDFEDIAQTLARAIKKSGSFNSKEDKILIRGVSTKDDFKDLLKDAKKLESQFGRVGDLSLVSHAGLNQGPIFPKADSSGERQFTGGEAELKTLNIGWNLTGEAKFYGCNTAVNFAQQFANAQGVRAWGFDIQSSMSSSPYYKDKGNRLNFGANPNLYMVGRDGRGMVKKDPKESR